MVATTIEQSKRLLELGLDQKTADMYYLPQVMNEGETLWPIDEGYDLDDVDQPAWSLSALLEVMPNKIESDDIQYYFHLEKSMKYSWCFISYYFDDVDELYELKTTKQYENPITAAYEMVCWLLENGYIKKGGNDD